MAAGNSGGLVNGVAALQTTHDNVIAVGAAVRTAATVHGLTNASNVFRAGYSQNGPDLTLMATTNVSSVDKFGNTVSFGGTSAANPNMAGIASLVWSINPNFDGGDVRQTLIETAMDIDAAGWDNNTAFGLVNADAAARRAVAWVRDPQLAALADSDELMILHNGMVLTPPTTPPAPFDDSSSGQLPPPAVLAALDSSAHNHGAALSQPSGSLHAHAGPAAAPVASPEFVAAVDDWHRATASPIDIRFPALETELTDQSDDKLKMNEFLLDDQIFPDVELLLDYALV